MKKHFFLGMAAFIVVATASAQIPVTDGAHIAKSVVNQVESVVYYKEQIDQLRAQVKEAERMYKNVVGKRDIAGLMNDKLLKQYLSPDMQKRLNDVRRGKGAAGISGEIDDIVRMNQARSCSSYGSREVQARCKAEWQGYAMKQHVGETGYARAVAEIDDLQQFVDNIKNTEDPKTMQDLQARISLNQVKVQAEVTKLQFLQEAEKASQEMNRRNAIDRTKDMLKPGMIRF